MIYDKIIISTTDQPIISSQDGLEKSRIFQFWHNKKQPHLI